MLPGDLRETEGGGSELLSSSSAKFHNFSHVQLCAIGTPESRPRITASVEFSSRV